MEIFDGPSIGYYSGMGGVEVKDFEYTADGDYMYCVSFAFCPKIMQLQHRLKVYSTAKGRLYVNLNGYRVHLDEIIQV